MTKVSTKGLALLQELLTPTDAPDSPERSAWKECRGCGHLIRREHFPEDRKSKDGRTMYCFDCRDAHKHRFLTHEHAGQRGTLKDLADAFGMPYNTVWNRLYRNGYSLKDALECPVQRGGRRETRTLSQGDA